MQRHDRLDVEHMLGTIEGPGIEIGVELKGQTDQIRNGVLRTFGKLFSVIRVGNGCIGYGHN